MEWLVPIIAAILGAVVGAGVTAIATWWVSVRLGEDREKHLLLIAISVVMVELESNEARLAAPEARGHEMTLGDWANHKPELGVLKASHHDLWRSLTQVYEQLFAWLSKSHDAVIADPEARRVIKAIKTLVGELDSVEKQIQLQIVQRRALRSLLPRGNAD